MSARGLTGLLVLAAQLLRDVGLVLAKQLGVQADIAGGINAVDVAANSLAPGDWGWGKGGEDSYPKPAAIEKYLEIGRKACSLRGGLVCRQALGEEWTHICQISSGLILVLAPLPRVIMHWVGAYWV